MQLRLRARLPPRHPRLLRASRGAAVFALAALPALACSASGSGSSMGVAAGGGAAGPAPAAGLSGAGGAGATGGLDAGFDAPAADSAAPPSGEVYGHSATTLYKLEPFSKQVSVVGDFDCIAGGEMWDIAIDKNGKMVGAVSGGLGSGSLVQIDRTTAKCTSIVPGVFPNSLSYLPAGTLLPNEEALVGYNVTAYVRIDPVSGQQTQLGDLNPNPTGQIWESSGDVVSIIGDKTYLTVHPLGAAFGPDSIVEIDPMNGQVVKLIGATGFTSLWGLGYWAGVAYGFSSAGELCEIDLGTGAGIAVPLTGIPAGLSFWGAGTTTAAPITVPR